MSPEPDGVSSRVMPEDLTSGFERLDLRDGDAVMLHSSLKSLGSVDGGAAMVLHRLLGVIGKKGTLMMPTFTSITTHSNSHDNHTKQGCWCEGREERHVPFIPELQPDKRIGEIAHRLCSWPASRRSDHPSFSFVAVGNRGEDLVRKHPPMDPLRPIKKMLELDPFLLTIGTEFDSMTAIHIAEERETPLKFEKVRALTVTSKGQVWVDVLGLGCCKGFLRVQPHVAQKERKETSIGGALVRKVPARVVIARAQSLLSGDPTALCCDNSTCLSCSVIRR